MKRAIATVMLVAATSATAQAQPAPDDAAPLGKGGTAPPAPPTVAHVTARADIHVDPDGDSAVVYQADPFEALTIGIKRGAWTQVATPRGIKGWVLAAELEGSVVEAQPHDPYPPAEPAIVVK